MRRLLPLLVLALAAPALAAEPTAPAPREAGADAPAIRRGEPVTIVVRSGALLIIGQGRALSQARTGEPVRVVNLATHRTLEGIAEGAGRVRIPID